MRARNAAASAALVLILGLAGCGGPSGGAVTPTPTTTASAGTSASATPSASPTATASLPTDCAKVGSDATRSSTLDQMSLQGDGKGFVRPAPTGATLALGCNWIEGDATGVLLLISTVDPDAAVSYAQSTLPAQGYTCTVQLSKDSTQFPVTVTQTAYARGDVWIYLETSNVVPEQLLDDLVAEIWGS
jgi:hypothetical protein